MSSSVQNASAAAVVLASMSWPAFSQANTHREAEPHVHGAAEISFVVSGSELAVTLDSPLANILGFEHAPQTAAEKKTAEDAKHLLNDPLRIAQPAPDAQCAAANPKIALPFGTDQTDHDDHGHMDIEASYSFVCKNISRLDQITVTAFKTFPGIESAEVVFLGPGVQLAKRLTASSPLLRLK